VAAKPIPKPCFLDQCVPVGARNGEKRWRSPDGSRIYTWDSLHGEIEAFNARGRHVGVLDAETGFLVKEAVKGRKIDV
jgi:hypothetical protein